MTEEKKLHFLARLLRGDAIGFSQTITVTSIATFPELLTTFRKVYAGHDFKETSRYRWDILKNGRPVNLLPSYQSNWKKQALHSKTDEDTYNFLFGKLTFVIQSNLSVPGKQDAR